MTLTHLTDDELLRHAQTEFDPITGTALEADLLRRFAALLERVDDLESVESWMDDKSVALDELQAVFDLLDEFSVVKPEALRQKLERADKWYELADEAGDLFSRLTALQQSTL